MTWIQTSAGYRFDLVNPTWGTVNPLDIAHALSLINRFGGHTSRGYSVAQHSVFVSQNVQPENALHGLLHDAHEAYVGDITRPLKHLLGHRIREIESRIDTAIFERFGLSWTETAKADVFKADLLALSTEAHHLLGHGIDEWDWPNGIRPKPLDYFGPIWSPDMAESMFLRRLEHLITTPVDR